MMWMTQNIKDIEEQRKQSFGKIVEAYDKYRPGYPKEVIETLTKNYGLGLGSKVLEIGCGTGQFTSDLAALGCHITALDISPEMIAFASDKFSDVKNVEFHAASFEDFEAREECFDFILSATAFHWVSPEARTHKMYDLLKPGGVLAFMYNHDDYRTAQDPARVEIQKVYDTVKPFKSGAEKMEDKLLITFKEISSFFSKGEEFQLQNKINYNTESYIGFISTYSHHGLLSEKDQSFLLGGIEKAIKTHGGTLTIPYQTRLFCFEKGTEEKSA